MPRREFSKATRRQIAQRSKGICERHRWRPGEVCTRPAKEFDHLSADGLGGEPTLDNGLHACVKCHKEKTHEHDRPIMRKADAQSDAAAGVKRKSRPIQNRPPEPKPVRDRLPLPPRTTDIYGGRV